MGIKGKLDTLDKLIMSPNWDKNNLNYDQMKTLSELLAREAKQEEMRR